MPSLREIVAVLDTLYRPEWADDWDAVGTVVGDPDASVAKILLAVACLLTALSTPGEAAVVFENTGTLMGWSRVYVQQQGTNTIVSTPSSARRTASIPVSNVTMVASGWTALTRRAAILVFAALWIAGKS